MPPTGPWTVDYGETNCTASRSYGSAEKPLLLVLKRSVSDGATQLLIMQAGSGAAATQHDVIVTGGLGTAIRTTALDYSVTNPKNRIRSITLTAAQMRMLSDARRLHIKSQKSQDHDLALTQLPGVQASLDKCIADLSDYWHSSPASQLLVARGASGDILSIFSHGDYPTQAVVEGKTGKVGVRMLIDVNGKVRDCSINETSGSAVLDLQTCAIIRERGKFTPAIDKDGKAIRSILSQNVTWRLP